MVRFWQDLRMAALAAAIWAAFALLLVAARDLAGAVIIIWLPSGIAVAALQMSARSRWPWVCAALLGTQFALGCLTGLALGQAAIQSLAAMVQAVTCVLLITWWLGARDAIPRTTQHIVSKFGAAVGGSAAGLLIPLVLRQHAGVADLGWWFLANVLGILTAGPLARYSHATWKSRADLRLGKWFNPGFAACLAGCAVLAVAALQWRGVGLMPLLIAALVLVTTRYGQLAAVGVVLVYAAVATLFSFDGASPVAFAQLTRDPATLGLQVGMLAMLATALPIAALLASRDELARELRLRNEHLARNNTELGLAETLAGIGRWRFDLRSREHDWSPTMRGLFGLVDQPVPDTAQLLAMLPEGGAALIGSINKHRADRAPYILEYRLRLAEGEQRVLRLSIVNEFDRAGKRIALFGVAMDVTDRIRREEALDVARGRAMKLAAKAQKLANTDALTGLPNRRCTFARLEKLILAARITGRPLSAIIFDIDHFKKVNDRLGHQCGDAVLVQVAHTAQQQVRRADMVGRIGGEEFVWLLPEVSPVAAIGLAERLREAVERGGGDADLPQVTISIGVASLRDGEDSESLFARADRALYRAKNAGRNMVSRAA